MMLAMMLAMRKNRVLNLPGGVDYRLGLHHRSPLRSPRLLAMMEMIEMIMVAASACDDGDD